MNGRKLIPGKPLPPRKFPTTRSAATRSTRSSPTRSAAPQAHRRDRQAIRRTARGQHLLSPTARSAIADELPGAELAPARRNALARGAVQGAPARSRRQRRPQRAARALVEPEARILRRRHHVATPTRSSASTTSRASFRGGCTCSPAIRARCCPGSSTARAELAFDLFHVDGGHTSEVCLSDMTQLHSHGPGRARPASAARRRPRELDLRHLLRVRRRAAI